MRVLFKLIMLGVVALVVSNYMAYQNSGSVLVSGWPMRELPVREWVTSAKSEFNKVLNKEAVPDVKTVKISKWTDAKGVVHYENRPVDGANTIEVDPNVNILPPAPSVKLPEAKEEKPKTMNDEMRDIQEAKRAYFDTLTQ